MPPNSVRQQRIMQLLEEQGKVRVSDLGQAVGASQATIRRDLDELAKGGYLERKHGVAVLIHPVRPEPMLARPFVENLAEKQRIGRAAAALIQPGEAVFLGAGTTTLEVARNLCGGSGLTIITNALPITTLLAREDGIALVTTGGILQPEELCFVGHITEQTMRELRPQKIITGIRAISLEAGLTSNYLREVPTDRVILESGREVILVADHTKFGLVCPAFVAPVTAVHTLVTDDQTPPETVARLQELGLKVIVC